MFENVAEHLDEAIRLSDLCPEKYQVSCFEALIRVLAESDAPLSRTEQRQIERTTSRAFSGNGEATASGTNGSDSDTFSGQQQRATDRGSLFLSQYQIPDESISRVYHLDGDSYRIIVKDLKEKTTSKKQIKLALLLGVAGLLAGGQPAFSKQRLIEVCREYGAYDGPNFASHMKRQRDMFIAQGNEWSLTVPAQQRAAEAIKELAS